MHFNKNVSFELGSLIWEKPVAFGTLTAICDICIAFRLVEKKIMQHNLRSSQELKPQTPDTACVKESCMLDGCCCGVERRMIKDNDNISGLYACNSLIEDYLSTR